MNSKQKWIIAGIAYLLLIIAVYWFISPEQSEHDDHAVKTLMSSIS